jgi:hypothetical protein
MQLLANGFALHVQGGNGAFDLLEVRVFVVCQPLGVGIHGALAWLSRPAHRRRPGPGVGHQGLQNRQQSEALGRKGLQGELKFLLEIVSLLDPGGGIDSFKARTVLAEDQHDVLAPHVRTGAQVGKHVSGGPFTVRPARRAGVSSSMVSICSMVRGVSYTRGLLNDVVPAQPVQIALFCGKFRYLLYFSILYAPDILGMPEGKPSG